MPNERLIVVGLTGPYLTRRVAQTAWEYSAGGCSSSVGRPRWWATQGTSGS